MIIKLFPAINIWHTPAGNSLLSISMAEFGMIFLNNFSKKLIIIRIQHSFSEFDYPAIDFREFLIYYKCVIICRL